MTSYKKVGGGQVKIILYNDSVEFYSSFARLFENWSCRLEGRSYLLLACTSPPPSPNVHLLMLKYSEITSPCSACSCCKQSASWSRFLRDYRTKGARVPIPDKAVTRDSLGRFFLISSRSQIRLSVGPFRCISGS